MSEDILDSFLRKENPGEEVTKYLDHDYFYDHQSDMQMLAASHYDGFIVTPTDGAVALNEDALQYNAYPEEHKEAELINHDQISNKNGEDENDASAENQ